MEVSVQNAATVMAKRSTKSEDWLGLVPSLLTLVWLVPFFFVPLAYLLIYSFATQDYLTGAKSFGWTLSAWERISDPVVLAAFTRSVIAAATTTALTALIGYPIAYFVARHAGRFQALALVLVIVPFWVSFIVRAYAWVDLLADHGLINRLLINIGLTRSPIPLVNNMVGIVIGLVYGYLPLMVFPLYASLRASDPRLLEAARDLGASWWTAFWRVTFPQALPGLVAGATIVFIPALGEFVIPSILGGGKTFLFGNLIALKFSRFTWPEGAALAIGVLVLALAIIGIATVTVGRKRFGEAVTR
jgi:spermidine/putrescine transport system permease protein